MILNSRNLSNICVVDVETTGPDVFKHDVLYIYMAPLIGTGPELELYIKYEDKELLWGSVASRYSKSYKDSWDLNAVDYRRAWSKFVDFIDTSFESSNMVFCGHNVGFDFSFLKKLAHLNNSEMPRKVSHRSLDVHSILLYLNIKGILPKSAVSSRGSIDYFKLNRHSKTRHDAKDDVYLTREVLMKLLKIDELALNPSQ